jgi:hypothetical protein
MLQHVDQQYKKKPQWLHVSSLSYFLQFSFISFHPPLHNDKSRSDIGGPEGGAYETASSWDCDAVCIGSLPVSMT